MANARQHRNTSVTLKKLGTTFRAEYVNEPGMQECIFGSIGIQPPVVYGYAENGQTIWVYDILGGYQTAVGGRYTLQGLDVWWSGSYGGSPISYTNYYTGQVAQGSSYGSNLDNWTINPGWTVLILQEVYADGYWTWNANQLQACAF